MFTPDVHAADRPRHRTTVDPFAGSPPRHPGIPARVAVASTYAHAEYRARYVRRAAEIADMDARADLDTAAATFANLTTPREIAELDRRADRARSC